MVKLTNKIGVIVDSFGIGVREGLEEGEGGRGGGGANLCRFRRNGPCKLYSQAARSFAAILTD